MNKKDLKNLAKETAAAPVDPNKIPVYSREDFEAAVKAVAKEFAEAHQLHEAEVQKIRESEGQAKGDDNTRVKDRLWWDMYCSAITGQMGWLNGAISDAKRFETRLGILADIASAAVNFAIKRGKVTK